MARHENKVKKARRVSPKYDALLGATVSDVLGIDSVRATCLPATETHRFPSIE